MKMGPFDYKKTPEMFLAYIDALVSWFEEISTDGNGGWSPAFEKSFKRLVERELHDNAMELCRAYLFELDGFNAIIRFQHDSGNTGIPVVSSVKFSLSPNKDTKIFYSLQDIYEMNPTVPWTEYDRRRL